MILTDIDGPRSLTARKTGRRRAALGGSRTIACAALAAGIATACAPRKPPPERTDAVYAGPSLSLEQSGGEHVVVAATPASGWTVTIDQVRDAHRARELYLTLREPHPAFVLLKSPQSQRVGTGVPATVAAPVFARVVAHDAPARPEDPYALALPARPKP